MAQFLSGSNVDDFSAPYISAVENFEKEAQSVFFEFGGRGNLGDPSSTDSSAAATGRFIYIYIISYTSRLLKKQVF